MDTSPPKGIIRKRNERERRRVQGINEVLNVLKDRLPSDWTTPKMSKLEILRKSTSYIKLLMEMSMDEEAEMALDESIVNKQLKSTAEEDVMRECKEDVFSGSSQSSICSVGALPTSSGEMPVASSDEFVLTDRVNTNCAYSGNYFPVVSTGQASTTLQSVSLQEWSIEPLFTRNYRHITHQSEPVVDKSDLNLTNVDSVNIML
ncbi:achaete-scute homolog 2-like [Argopecten irradians]|uniref:achaete-scute homolog 2-like n=1 Tax=Argopecten irradians TaxID=31199 RepID=UPI003717243E